jgi:hypothetical protein
LVITKIKGNKIMRKEQITRTCDKCGEQQDEFLPKDSEKYGNVFASWSCLTLSNRHSLFPNYYNRMDLDFCSKECIIDYLIEFQNMERSEITNEDK